MCLNTAVAFCREALRSTTHHVDLIPFAQISGHVIVDAWTLDAHTRTFMRVCWLLVAEIFEALECWSELATIRLR